VQTSVLTAPISVTTGAGEKLVISGTMALVNGGGGATSHTGFIVVDGGNVASIPSQVPPVGVLGSGANITVHFETAVLAAGAHTIDLQALATSGSQSFGNAQLQVLRVLV
jgi:hypothetical protein